MVIYIEYVILNNLIIDLILLYLTSITLNEKVKLVNLFLGASIGVLIAIVFPLLKLNGVWCFLFKISCGIFIVLFVKKFKNIIKFLLFYIVFISYTFLMGGLIYGLYNLLGEYANYLDILALNSNVPISIFVLLIFIYFMLIMYLIKAIKYKKNIEKYYYDVVLCYNKKSYFFQGFLDTGNVLKDDLDKGIIIIDAKNFCKIFNKEMYIKLLLDLLSEKDIENIKYMHFASINNCNKLAIFKSESITINYGKIKKTFNNISVGISKTNFKNFDCLLGEDFF